MENNRQKKKRWQNWFPHLNWSSREFQPQFWICLSLCLHWFSLMLHKLKSYWNKIHFVTTLKLGMKQGLQGQIAIQRQDDFKDNFTCVFQSLQTFKLVDIWSSFPFFINMGKLIQATNGEVIQIPRIGDNALRSTILRRCLLPWEAMGHKHVGSLLCSQNKLEQN
jgi:hypothetical protein